MKSGEPDSNARADTGLRVFVTGAGRSGTSALAGLFSQSSVNMGARIYPPRDANPKGFFESPEINHINDQIIRESIAALLADTANTPVAQVLGLGHPWLAVLPPDADLKCSPTMSERIRKSLGDSPFCYKDPRFLVTLPVWLDHLTELPFILCAVRHPGEVVASMVKEILSANYLHNFVFSIDMLLLSWTAAYVRFLDTVVGSELAPVKFVGFDSIVGGSCIDELESLLGIPMDRSFPDSRLKRSARIDSVPEHAVDMFELLDSMSRGGTICGLDAQARARLSHIRDMLCVELHQGSTRGHSLSMDFVEHDAQTNLVLSGMLRQMNGADARIHDLEERLAAFTTVADDLSQRNAVLTEQLNRLLAFISHIQKQVRAMLGLSGDQPR